MYNSNIPTRPSHDPSPSDSPRQATRVATLERRAPKLVDQARQAGVDIGYLGITPLFDGAQGYSGASSDWVVAPVKEANRETVPEAERQSLESLLDVGIDFPLIYIAHELPKGQLPVICGSRTSPVPVEPRHLVAAQAAPVPETSIDVSQRLGSRAEQLLHLLGKALPIVGGVALTPLVLAGAAVGALARLDPIVFGVLPVGAGAPGEPAAWFVLAQWDW